VVVAVVVASAVAASLAVVSPASARHVAVRPTKPHTETVPAPPPVVVGSLVVNAVGGLRYGAPVTPVGGWCSLGACWATIVTPNGYVYPVRGTFGAKHWHVAGPALAGPGISPKDHYLAVDTRSSTGAVVWTSPDSFDATYDGGHHWYRVTDLSHPVAVGDVGSGLVAITIGLPGDACDWYFTYSSTAGAVWRRGGPLKDFSTTSLGPTAPSCLETART
jgi:hypothetical protein